MSILVATPARAGVDDVFIEQSKKLVAGLEDTSLEHVVFADEFPAVPGNRCARHAGVRNALIDTHLEKRHSHVLWMDVDVVEAPRDLVDRLLGVSEDEVVAPFVLIEGTKRFYDLKGFVFEGDIFEPTYPYCWRAPGAPVFSLDSVGTCYIMPAEWFRCGVRYSAIPGEIEHNGLCRDIRKAGGLILAHRYTTVYHANLPKWGKPWHTPGKDDE